MYIATLQLQGDVATQVAKATSYPTWAAVIPSSARNYGVFLLAADSDSWLCSACKEHSQPVAAAPPLIHRRVHRGCRVMAPKTAACLGTTMVSLWQTVGGPNRTVRPCRTSNTLWGAGSGQVCDPSRLAQGCPAWKWALQHLPALWSHWLRHHRMFVNKRQEN